MKWINMVNVSLKEFYAIEDQLEAEQMLVAKYRSYAESCSDDSLRDKCNHVADVHQKHYNTLLGYLK